MPKGIRITLLQPLILQALSIQYSGGGSRPGAPRPMVPEVCGALSTISQGLYLDGVNNTRTTDYLIEPSVGLGLVGVALTVRGHRAQVDGLMRIWDDYL